MDILVLIAGVADWRYPLHPLSVSDDGMIVEGAGSRRRLSPFDEASLELALALRDQQPDCRVEALVISGENNQSMLRSVGAYKPDDIRSVDLAPTRMWDAALTSRQMAACIRGREHRPDLILMGREFGDLDEGGIPVMLAERLSLPLFSMAQVAVWEGSGVRLMREQGTYEEWIDVAAPLLATVTNDQRNRLRYPLMKNVMLAKRMSFDAVTAQDDEAGTADINAIAPPPAVAREGTCRMLTGDPAQQVEELVRYLREREDKS